MTYKKNVKGINKASRFVALAVCLLLLLPLFPLPQISADNESTNGNSLSSKTYMLTVSSGIVPGDIVSYFNIRYIDTNGVTRSQIVVPDDETVWELYSSVQRSSKLKDSNIPEMFELNEFPTYNDSVSFEGRSILRANSTEQFVFKTIFPIQKVESVDAYLKYKEPSGSYKNEWTLKDFAVYEVYSLGKLDSLGYFSYDYYVDFKGKLIAEFVPRRGSGLDISVEYGDAYARFGVDNTYACQIKTDFTEEEAKVSSVPNDELYIRLDIADTYDAGIDAYLRNMSGSGRLEELVRAESLIVNITYEDNHGGVYSAAMPFFTSAVLYAYSTGVSRSGNYYGIGQQNDSMLVKGYFPNFYKLTGFSLYYGSEAQTKGELDYLTGSNYGDREKQRKKFDSDTLSVYGVTIYKNVDPYNFNVYSDNAALKCKCGNSVLYSYKENTYDGNPIEPNTVTSIFSKMQKMSEPEDTGATILPSEAEDTLVIELKTDDVEDAGTQDLIKVKLNYETYDGLIKETDEIDLRIAADDFYGIWQASDIYSENQYLNGNHYGYYYYTQAGQTLSFRVNAPNVKKVNSISIVKDKGKEDDWQIKGINVYRSVHSPERREYNVEADDMMMFLEERYLYSDVYHYRDYSDAARIAYVSKRMRFGGETLSMTVNFEEGGSIDVDDSSDWDDISRSMTYREALQDLGFLKTRGQYEVTVKVASNAEANEVDGDSGSNNQFYFQLIFENGKSAYVQANQQLYSDGFRAGKNETFYIRVNRNYGDLKAIHIIADDMLEETDVYDKLNIERISVAMLNDGGYNRSWKFDNVGWIGINFHDSGARDTLEGQKLRSEAEMAQVANRTGKGYTMKFMLSVTTKDYSAGSFGGSVKASISYVTPEGSDTRDINVVSLISDYCGKGGSDKIDTSYMFRAGRTDRLYFTLDDVVEIKSIKFNITSENTTNWTVSGFDLYQVVEDGLLIVNARGEYQQDAKLEYLACGDETSYTFTLDKGKQFVKTVRFVGHTISVDDESGESHVERTPRSDNDTVNIYAYLDKSYSVTGGEHGVNAAFTYTIHSSESEYQAVAKNMLYDGTQKMLYAPDIPVSGFVSINKLTLKSMADLYISYAVVQHVRDGVVIGTYYFDYTSLSSHNANRGSGISTSPSETGSLKKQTQTVSFRLPYDMGTIDLDHIDGDIALAIRYTSSIDVEESVYVSPYSYLTDYEGRAILKAGELVTFEFNESYVSEIVGINILGRNIPTVRIPLGSIVLTSTDYNGSVIDTKQYTFEGIEITNTLSAFDVTEGNTCSFDIEIESGAINQSAPNGLSVIVNGMNEKGENVKLTFDNAASFITQGNLRSGVCRISFTSANGENLARVSSIRIVPVGENAEDTLEWYVEYIKTSWNCGYSSGSAGYAVRSDIGKTGYTVSASNKGFTERVEVYDAEGKLVRNYDIDSGKSSHIVVENGYTVNCVCTTNGTLAEYELELISGNKNGYRVSERNGTLTIAFNDVDDLELSVTVISAYNPDVSYNFKFAD